MGNPSISLLKVSPRQQIFCVPPKTDPTLSESAASQRRRFERKPASPLRGLDLSDSVGNTHFHESRDFGFPAQADHATGD